LHEIHSENEEKISFWLCMDGFQDQFGGEKDKKFMVKRLRETLFSLHTQPMREQGQQLEKVFDDWKSEREQVDDVTILGVKF
jgi:hypothetical protein